MTIENHILNILFAEGKQAARIELDAMYADGFLSDEFYTRLYNLVRWF